MCALIDSQREIMSWATSASPCPSEVVSKQKPWRPSRAFGPLDSRKSLWLCSMLTMLHGSLWGEAALLVGTMGWCGLEMEMGSTPHVAFLLLMSNPFSNFLINHQLGPSNTSQLLSFIWIIILFVLLLLLNFSILLS